MKKNGMKREPELTSFSSTLFIFWIVLQPQNVTAPAAPFSFNSGYYQGQSAASVQMPVTTPATPFGFNSGYYQGQLNASLHALDPAAPAGFDSRYYQGQSMASLQSPALASMTRFGFDSSLRAPVPAADPVVFTSAPYIEQPGASFQSPSPLSPTPTLAPIPMPFDVRNVFSLTPYTITQQEDSNKFVSVHSADEAYQKLANGNFLLNIKSIKSQAKNPFDMATSAPRPTLARLKANKDQVSIFEKN